MEKFPQAGLGASPVSLSCFAGPLRSAFPATIFPAALVKEKLLKLDSQHIDYVFECLDKNTTYVRNIKKYLLATLFNAPSTIDSYYLALVNHDLYGDGSRGQ